MNTATARKQSVLVKNQSKQLIKRYKEGGKTYVIIANVRHDDNCGNGHNSFGISGEIWTAQNYDKYLAGYNADCVSCGQIIEPILKHFPKLRPLMKWHLTSTDGPMHYIANSLYWAEKGNLEAFKRCAVWPDFDGSLDDKHLKEKLLARLSGLMYEFQDAVEEFGFVY